MTITIERDAGVARLTMDDGKANAFDLEFFEQLDAALDDCADSDAVVLAGRDGMFSGGLNLKVLQGLQPDGLLELLTRFGATMHRLWLEPRPVVAAATGHAVAGGAIMAMACDHAVAADGDFRWGLNEVAIGMIFPSWILAIARANLRSDRLEGLLLSAAFVSPAQAVEVGYADELAPAGDVLARAEERARALAALPRHAYADTKRRLRGEASAQALAASAEELRAVLGAG